MLIFLVNITLIYFINNFRSSGHKQNFCSYINSLNKQFLINKPYVYIDKKKLSQVYLLKV